METIYNHIFNYIQSHKIIKRILFFIYQYFPIILFLIYPSVLFYLFIKKHTLFFFLFFRPLFAFLFVTIFRKIINRPRPYETLNIKTLKKHKKGESFPSRHTLSAFIIAFCCFSFHPYLGCFSLIIAICIALSRFLMGVHYLSDIFIAIIIAFLFYYI